MPLFSPYAAAGKTTSACELDDVRKVSTAMTWRAPARALRARSASTASAIGSLPTRTRHSTACDAAASRMPIASFPPRGASPAASAPRTFPRRNTGNTLAPGAIVNAWSSAATTVSALCARFARPTTTTTDPEDNCAESSAPASRNAWASLPGSAKIVFHAYGVSPVGRLVTSTMRERFLAAASRRRRYSTGNSSLTSGAIIRIVRALEASSIVACGRPNTSDDNPSPS